MNSKISGGIFHPIIFIFPLRILDLINFLWVAMMLIGTCS